MERISQCIVNFIRRNMPVEDEEMLDVYKYGIEITLSSLLNLAMIIVCSLLLGDFAAGLIFMACFVLLRSYTGGYHAETYWRCNVVFVCTFILTYYAGRVLNLINTNIYAAAGIMLPGIFPIIKFAPVKNRHKILSESKRKKSKAVSLVLFVWFLILSLLMIAFDIWYGYLILSTTSAVSVMIIIEIFMQSKGYHDSGN